MQEALLRLDGLTKAYPGVIANKDISFQVEPGEIHALLGENGAGKSTLVKMIYGLVKPDAGRMEMAGKPHAPNEPRLARAAGVGMVFQHFSLFDALSVAENIALGMDDAPGFAELSERIRDVSRAYGLPLDPDRLVGALSAGERQRVEIIRCLLGAPRLLIMDEPTSVLTPQEVEILFATLRKLASEGTSILYISHKLEEIRALCDAATILRAGAVVATCTPAEQSARALAEMMVGKALETVAKAPTELGDVKLGVSNLTLAAETHFGTGLKDVTFELRAGEILGVGGVAGNGQDEFMAALSGERRASPGHISFLGQDIGPKGPAERRSLGLLTGPEERLGHAAVPDMSLVENAALTGHQRKEISRGGFLNWQRARTFAEEIILSFDVRTPGPHVAARALSGGNLQKFVVGREILQRPEVLAVDQPTWGVDAAAAAAIRQALMDLAKQGAAVIVVSQDLDELLEVSDRFCALNAGRLSPSRPTAGLSMDEIGLMLGGTEDAA